MKKSITIIGKVLVKAIIVITGLMAFCEIVGEPTEDWYEWSRNTFGVFSGLWFFASKMLAILAIYLLFKVWKVLFPEDYEREMSEDMN